MTSPEHFPPPGPGELAPARKRGSSSRNTQPQPAPPGDGDQGSQSERQDTSDQAQPPEYQAQPPEYRARPAEHELQPQSLQHQQQPGYQQTQYQQPQYQQQPGYQYQQAQYQQPQYQQQAPYQQSPGYQHPLYAQQQQPAYGGTQRRSRRGWMFALAAVVLLVPMGIGTWYLARGWGGSSDSDGAKAIAWPDNPQFQYSLSTGIDERSPYSGYFPIAGSSGDLYVAGYLGDTSTVAHYVDGELDWESTVGLKNPEYFNLSGDIVILNSADDDYNKNEMTRLDPETGSTVWTTTLGYGTVWLRDDRLYVLTYPVDGEGASILAEYDLDSGNELSRVSGDNFRYVDDGFIQTDSIELTARFIDLDFEPVGNTIAIEPSGNTNPASVVDRNDEGWVFFADRSTYGGESRVVGVSATGDARFECQTQLEQPSTISMRDSTTLVVESYHEMEVIDIDGSTCTSRWSYEGSDLSGISAYRDYPEVWTYADEDRDLESASGELLDWNTGTVIATGENTILTDGDDRMVTFNGPTIIASQISTGNGLWMIDATADSHLRLLDGMFIVIIPDGSTATLDIYSD